MAWENCCMHSQSKHFIGKMLTQATKYIGLRTVVDYTFSIPIAIAIYVHTLKPPKTLRLLFGNKLQYQMVKPLVSRSDKGRN